MPAAAAARSRPTSSTALDDGTLAGASLDVFETEPLPPESPLWAASNRHDHAACRGGLGPGRRWRAQIAEQIEAFERGERAQEYRRPSAVLLNGPTIAVFSARMRVAAVVAGSAGSSCRSAPSRRARRGSAAASVAPTSTATTRVRRSVRDRAGEDLRLDALPVDLQEIDDRQARQLRQPSSGQASTFVSSRVVAPCRPR